MSGLLGKIPKLTLKLPASLAKAGRTMSESPLDLSFSICEEGVLKKTKAENILHVSLDEEKSAMPRLEKLDVHQKADEEKNNKEDNMEVTCSVSVDGQEKQEFFFTLYDFDTKERANKQDVEKIVVRSICEALGKTLKLPPSGSRTIKVKLAISPDSSKDTDNPCVLMGDPRWPMETKHQDYDSSKSANTASTYLLSSSTEKQPSGHRCSLPLVVSAPLQQVAKAASPRLKALPHSRLVSVQKHVSRDLHKKSVDGHMPDNARIAQSDAQRKTMDEQQGKCQNPQHLISRAHAMESRERRNHYLDLAGVESNGNHDFAPKSWNTPPVVESNYVCPYRILDRGHVCSRTHRNKDCQTATPNKRSSAKDILLSPNIAPKSRTRTNTKDLLNLNFELCDLVPEAKFDWDKMHHRRSKSYDLHETALNNSTGLYSPKLMSRPTPNADAMLETGKNRCPPNSSPVHNFRFRQRDKERQRAMQQVANWIAQEHSKGKEHAEMQFLCRRLTKSPREGSSENHDHRHHHEHVHHHYHHFVDF